MGNCIAQPKVDGRRYTDRDLNEYTLLYQNDTYMPNEIDPNGSMLPAVVLVDVEGDVVVYPECVFLEDFQYQDDESLDLFEAE